MCDLVGRRRDSYTPCAGSAERMSRQPPHTGTVIICGNFNLDYLEPGNVHNKKHYSAKPLAHNTCILVS